MWPRVVFVLTFLGLTSCGPAPDITSASFSMKTVNYFGGATERIAIEGTTVEYEAVPAGPSKLVPIRKQFELNSEQQVQYEELLRIASKQRLWNQRDVREEAMDGGETTISLSVGEHKGGFKLVNASPKRLRPFLQQANVLMRSIADCARGIGPKYSETNGLRLGTQPVSAAFGAGSDLRFNLAWSNISDHEFLLYGSGHWLVRDGRWRFRFQDEQGRTWQAARLPDGHEGGKPAAQLVKPGESLVDSVLLDQRFVFTPENGETVERLPPGAYRFQAIVEFVEDPMRGVKWKEPFWLGTMESAWVPFTVTPEDQVPRP